jgi:hypothetical protein
LNVIILFAFTVEIVRVFDGFNGFMSETMALCMFVKTIILDMWQTKELNFLQVTERVLKELQSQILQNKQVNAIVSRLALEVEKLTPEHLVQFCEYCIHCIQHEDGEQTR